MIKKQKSSFNNSAEGNPNEKIERDSKKIKEMQDRDYQQRQKREHDIEVERTLHEETF